MTEHASSFSPFCFAVLGLWVCIVALFAYFSRLVADLNCQHGFVVFTTIKYFDYLISCPILVLDLLWNLESPYRWCLIQLIFCHWLSIISQPPHTLWQDLRGAHAGASPHSANNASPACRGGTTTPRVRFFQPAAPLILTNQYRPIVSYRSHLRYPGIPPPETSRDHHSPLA